MGVEAAKENAMADSATFRALADRCRNLATDADERTAANLLMLAQDYEDEALQVEAKINPPTPPVAD
jgi:hypothetical protein